MDNKEKFIIDDISIIWKEEIGKTADKVVVFSPYLTSPIAEEVLILNRTWLECDVYTLFEPEIFVTGASCLRTLRNLIEAGVTVFSLPNLHAKIVLVPDHFASVGSQNLTKGGTAHREATAITTNSEQVEAIQSSLRNWSSEGKAINVDMINDMDKEIEPLLNEYNKIKENFEYISDLIDQNECIRKVMRPTEEAEREFKDVML